MTKDGISRFSSVTSSSTDSGRTVKPSRFSSSSSRRADPKRLKMEDAGTSRRSVPADDPPVSPTSTTPTHNRPPSTTPAPSGPDRRMSDLANYRQDLCVLDPAGGSRNPRGQHNMPPPSGAPPLPPSDPTVTSRLNSDGSTNTQASASRPYNEGNANPQATGPSTSFYHDSSDNVSLSSHKSPSFRSVLNRTGSSAQHLGAPDSPDPHEERRPSFASITTLSSQGSKNSLARGGLRKLQGFFGEEFPGSDTSLPPPAVPPKDGKDNKDAKDNKDIKENKDGRPGSFSHSRVQRGRNHSNATDYTRDASPSSSRPRTPVPAPEVVPFLYQEPDDIARYGEAPVRDILTGPDRNRYASEGGAPVPPKTASSARSGHSLVHLPGHPGHRQNRSIDDPRAYRPSVSRDDSLQAPRERGSSSAGHGVRSRPHSPAPNPAVYGKAGSFDGQTSPANAPRRGLLGRLRRSKDRDEDGFPRLRDLPKSTRSLASKPSRTDLQKSEAPAPAPAPNVSPDTESQEARSRTATFNNKFPFSKRTRTQRTYDVNDEPIGPTDQSKDGTMFFLDTDLGDMNGILNRPAALTPMDRKEDDEPEEPDVEQSVGNAEDPSWNAPVSWAVRRTTEDNSYYAPDADDIETPVDEDSMPYCIRIFKSDGTFTTLATPLSSTVSDVIDSIGKKMVITKDGLPNYHIVLRKRDLVRILSSMERPLLLQKKLLHQFGYDERDRLEDLGREDNSYLCRFMFLSAIESESQQMTKDLGLSRMAKVNHIDLSGRNLFNIPLSLYSKAPEIVSLNLSRNLSLDVPRDFIQSCTSLRDIKFNNNEARKLPPSFSRASKLTMLDASNNRLDHLDGAELEAIKGLLKLNLANNRLTKLPIDFGTWTNLRTLNLSSNYIETFPNFICELHNLVDLDLSFNSISVLHDDIAELQSLERFVITNNRLSGILPQAFKDLISLRELDIKYNAITSIDVVSELPKLEVLSVDHNSVSRFIGSFETLRSLRLNSNPVTKFEIVQPVLTLKMLNLSNAQLASIDESFPNILNLESLILDRNYFVSLPPHIGKLGRLEYFSIANNTVGTLPAQIGCLTELRVLDIRGNNIRKLPMEIWWANKLEVLNASSNVLVNFPKPASRPPRIPGEESSSPPVLNGKYAASGTLTAKPSMEDVNDPSRRPSQASSTLLSVGPSPVPGGPDRKGSVVSVYGKGGRKTSVVSRSTSGGTIQAAGGPGSRKDSTLSARLANTFAGSLRTLQIADNQLDDDVFEQIVLLPEIRVLNLSYNEISDIPQRLIKSWPQLMELYLSGNELTSLPADDLEESSLLQVLHINANRFTNLPADISRAKKLAVLDCGSNYLKYNIANVPYDWNWNLNPDLRYLNLSGNKRLEIKQTINHPEHPSLQREQYTDFNRLQNLRILGLMDVTLTQPRIPDQSEDRRVRTSGSLAGHLPYGMADTLGKNEHLSTIDLVVPRFNSSECEMLLGLFDGQALSSGGSKIAKYLHEHFGRVFTTELKGLRTWIGETPTDALRRAFLSLNKDLANIATQYVDEHSPFHVSRRGNSAPPLVLSPEDVTTGGVATVIYLRGMELYVANIGDAQAMLITEGTHKILTRKHDPAEPSERQRIREAGGWVSRHGLLNDQLEVSRAFGYVNLMPAVQAAPHVSHITIREQDDIIVIGTRELWEYLSPGLVVDVARAERVDLMRAAQKLRDLAIAYGASGKIMVMMISVADLKRRVERSRGGRPSMMWPSGLQDDLQMQVTKRPRKKGDVLDSTLQRLEAEIPAPTGNVSIVFTDIKNSTTLWEMYPSAMRSAIKLHNEQMRRQLRHIGGYEVKTEGDAFMVSFPTATSALLWCFAVQMSLLEVNWPSEVVNSISGQPIYDKENTLIFKGLSVRMGIHFGETVSETDPVTRRMDYFGPMVNKASRISAVADGGQITVSSDFISEVQRCLESYQEAPPLGSASAAPTPSAAASDDEFDDEQFSASIRKDLRALSSQGFEVKDMGERKLKGLENPEVIYSLYPHALVGRIEFHQLHERQEAAGLVGPTAEKAISATAGGAPIGRSAVDPEMVWSLWKVSLRLEMMCSALESEGHKAPRPPELDLLERVKMMGDVSDVFLFHFLEHQVSRVETTVTTLATRHLAAGGDKVQSLNALRGPMEGVFQTLKGQLDELQRYKEMFGPLEPSRDDSQRSSGSSG